MRITEAARRLEMTPRMLRYRESLGLLPALRHSGRRAGRGARAGRGTALRPSARLAVDGSQAGSAPHGGAPLAGGARQADGARQAGGAPLAGGARQTGGAAHAGQPGAHRQFSDADMAAVALGLSIERRYDISPVALAFGVRVLADPRVRAEVAELGRRIGRLQPAPARALDFEQERALRLLNRP